MTTADNTKLAPSMSMSAEAPTSTDTQTPINATPYADPQYSVPAIMAAIYGDGITGLKGAFSREWVAKLGEELAVLYKDALARPGGAVGRGTNRHYVEIHPEDISGFYDLITHPWVQTVCASVLGPNYKIVEIGFDVPNPGAKDQPWHRDFRAGSETLVDRRLNSLAFNLTTVDVEEDMGPFEIAPGTQWDDPSEYDHGMFPPVSLYPRYHALAQRKYPKMGDISVRSALTIHRGTANTSNKPRPVLVLGVDAPGAGHDEWHDLQFTKEYYEKLPQSVKDHLICRVVDQLEPIMQGHTIEGLMMGDA
ncbi:phytanoyl-CoA dioxygenase family protein [Deinococcus apachensis]|uniref:phytanoyl-CoA dioxygenase family protein n=1 Tax=Deinococcus apachensis TaxID=309886 RepID=UPI0003789DAC|nr:phytanoyl-CoA dioxygenase family protein [Deinococcus apachensis]